MASYPDCPYAQFNFLIDLGLKEVPGPHGGFQEVSGLRKIKGLNKATDITLKRGVIASAALQDWLDEIRRDREGAKRTLTISQQNEEHQTVQTWKLSRSRIIKHTSGPVNAKGTDVAIEELVLAYERLELE
ncbi:MAG TPA: phage tail protein [Pyrinomonadaceae bacterium]|nr:phage tail protein [Pyrinomonadaceae bacterium]